MDNRHNLCPHCSSMMGGSIPMLGSRCTCNDTPVTRDGFVPVVAFDMRDARITALETALAAMTAERDAAIAELRNIAEADKPCSSLRCEFQAWAQSRARAAVEGER